VGKAKNDNQVEKSGKNIKTWSKNVQNDRKEHGKVKWTKKNFFEKITFFDPRPQKIFQKFFKKGHLGAKNIKMSRCRVKVVHFGPYQGPDGGFWGQATHSQHPFFTIPLASMTSRKKFKFLKHFQGQFWELRRCSGEPPEDPEWRSTVDAPFRA
jgi:hypothetical protein